MNRLSTNIILTILVFSFAGGQEITTFRDFADNYEAKWQIDKSQPKVFLVLGDSSFGIMPEGGGVYRHYDLRGQLLWASAEPADYAFVTEDGNKIWLLRSIPWANDIRLAVADVYDTFGNLICRIEGDYPILLLKSSPSGSYFYTIPDEESTKPFFIYNGNCEDITQLDRIHWNARALNDSLIIITDRNSIQLINVFTNEVVRNKPIDLSWSSLGNMAIVANTATVQWTNNWSDNKVVIFNPNWDVTSEIRIEEDIFGLAFIDTDLICVYSIDHNSLDQIVYLVSDKGMILDKWICLRASYLPLLSPADIYHNGNVIFINTCMVKRPSIQIIECSIVLQWDEVAEKIAKGLVLETRHYPLKASSDVLEDAPQKISCWSERRNGK